MDKLEYAADLVGRGFDVFPITAGAKAPPLIKDWPTHAGKDVAHWRVVPEANIGIHCKGLLVVDVDIHKGGIDSFKKLDDLLGFPNTLTHGTPTGGLHAIYRLPEGHPGVPNSVAVLGAGLDIRSTGGYIVAPGSTTSVGEYHVAVDKPIAPAPDWLVLKLGTSMPKKGTGDVNIPDAAEDVVQRAEGWLRTAERSVKGAGGDQAAYRVACALRDQGLSYEQACWAMRSEAWDYGCGWRDGWLEAKPIRSAYKYAQNEPGAKTVTAEAFVAMPVPKDAPQPKRARAQLAADLAAEPSSNNYIVKHWLERASYAEMYGAPGEGKTFAALDIAYHVAADKPWMENKVRGGVALYLAFEGKGGLRKRAKALREKYKNLDRLYIAGASMNLREQAGRQELAAVLAELPEMPALIVIDTFARALMGGDENSAQDVGAFNNAVEALIEQTGACVLIIHHSGKNKAAGARGSSALLGAIDTEIEVDGRQIISRKQREGEDMPPIGFALKPVSIGIDADNEMMTSCVVEPAQASLARKPLSAKGEHAFGILSEMTGPENKPVSRSLFVRKMIDEGIGRSAAHDWVRKLKLFNKATIEDDMITRRLA